MRGVVRSTELKREPAGKRTFRVLWKVEPHWRQQAYGRGRSLRRPVPINEHVKGPPRAAFRRAETVYVLDGLPMGPDLSMPTGATLGATARLTV